MTGGAHYESSDGIATITMDRPEVRNALDAATSRLIDEMLSRAEADADVGVIIVTGAGDKAFCSGMDLQEAARTGPGPGLMPGRGFAGLTVGSPAPPVLEAGKGAE